MEISIQAVEVSRLTGEKVYQRDESRDYSEIDALVEKALQAAGEFMEMGQEQVDQVVQAMALAGVIVKSKLIHFANKSDPPLIF